MLHIYKVRGKGINNSIRVGDIIKHTKWGTVVIVGINFIDTQTPSGTNRLKAQVIVQEPDSENVGEAYDEYEEKTFTYRVTGRRKPQLPQKGECYTFSDRDTNQIVDGALMQIDNILSVSSDNREISVEARTKIVAERGKDWMKSALRADRRAKFHVVINNDPNFSQITDSTEDEEETAITDVRKVRQDNTSDESAD